MHNVIHDFWGIAVHVATAPLLPLHEVLLPPLFYPRVHQTTITVPITAKNIVLTYSFVHVLLLNKQFKVLKVAFSENLLFHFCSSVVAVMVDIIMHTFVMWRD